MERKNIFQILEGHFDLQEEMLNINHLFFSDNFSDDFAGFTQNLETVVEETVFPKWSGRRGCISCQAMRSKLNIYERNDIPSDVEEPYSLEEIMIELEYFFNITMLGKSCTYSVSNFDLSPNHKFKLLLSGLWNIAETINHTFLQLPGKKEYILIERDKAALAVAEIVEQDIGFDILSYNHYGMKGNLIAKRKVLQAMANAVEPVTKQLIATGNKTLSDDTGFLLNNMNIRHNNIDSESKNYKAYVHKLPKEQLEKWYDEVYQLILLCFLQQDNMERSQKIAELKKVIG